MRGTATAAVIGASLVMTSTFRAAGFPNRPDLVEEMVCTRLIDFNDRGGQPPMVVDFDNLPPGIDLSDCSMCGVVFAAKNAPLIVVRGDETYTPAGFSDLCNASFCQLRATSGDQLLSPGGLSLAPGPQAALEDDDLTLIFDPPVSAVGFDHLSQHADGLSYTHVEVVAVDGTVLYSGMIPVSGGHEMFGKRLVELSAEPDDDGDPYTDFWGFVSNAVNIREVRIDERDDNNVCPDSNIGIDSLRFSPAPCGAEGDIDGDGVVTPNDARLLVDQWGEHNPITPMGPQWAAGDLNRDGKVDATDLMMLMSHLK